MSKVGDLFRADMEHYFAGSDFSRRGLFRLIRAWMDPDYRVVLYWRISSLLVRRNHKLLGILLYWRLKSRYTVDISPWADIGGGLRLMHAFDVVIGPGARIGAWCRIFNGVTLGKSRPDSALMEMPSVGDFCILGTGAKLLGKSKIEDGLIIGANAVVRNRIVRAADGRPDDIPTARVDVAYIESFRAR